ncbi:hypothetical protein [Pyrobaculum neutrophilum]|uniref:Uncharacterized protein n=1 Tax=Pyrobaculum neutrophilum (strain DSM 2338 / JCM 9278 / NBRC 100436 / V24Sta) TaxID=444157 RepID=B1YA60_PYRNV|nr:hypothetical protein [Pyrobaculum neutrophilum]ACB39034.1 conserved hypothetical protein [Pyrobaculum neutrophilum V24Sta]
MHKRSYKARVAGGKVTVNGKEIDVTQLTPAELLLAALAYGVGIRYIDKTGEPYELECEIDGYTITCTARCSGEEGRCLIYRALTEGTLRFHCRKV